MEEAKKVANAEGIAVNQLINVGWAIGGAAALENVDDTSWRGDRTMISPAATAAPMRATDCVQSI
jgi:hypothetical protein